MAILKESSGGDKSIEEQLQLRRVFRRIAFDLPLLRIEEKLQRLSVKISSASSEVSSTPKKSKTVGEYEAKLAKYIQERSKYEATLQDENNQGKELVTSRYHIDANALQYVFERLGCTLPHGRAQIEELIWEINDNLDGMISFEEFEKSYVRSKSDHTGLEPSEIFFLTCYLMFDRDCGGRIALDDAMKVFYLKYGDAMEEEMEIHFGKQLDEGAQYISFAEYREAILQRVIDHVDQYAALAKTNKYNKRGARGSATSVNVANTGSSGPGPSDTGSYS